MGNLPLRGEFPPPARSLTFFPAELRFVFQVFCLVICDRQVLKIGAVVIGMIEIYVVDLTSVPLWFLTKCLGHKLMN